MADGPIQVVLNQERFREARPVRRGGGANKDFFRDDDDGFVRHRGNLLNALNSIYRSNTEKPRVNVKVQMKPDALAKSHRPFGALFTPGRASHVGTGAYGELIFAVPTGRLREIISAMERAEVQVMWRRDVDGRPKYSPSSARTETSAIEEISQWIPSEERGFSLAEAENWLGSDNATKLHVEALDLPIAEAIRSLAMTELRAMSEIAANYESWFHLSGRAIESILTMPPSYGIGHERQTRQPRTANFEPEQFRRTLALFEASSVIKQISLEDQVTSDNEELSGSVGAFQLEQSSKRVSTRPIVGIIDGGIDGPFANSTQWVAGRSGLLALNHRGTIEVDHGTRIASLVAIGSGLNPDLLDESEDCRVYDLDLFPANQFHNSYYSSLSDFLDEVRASVGRAKSSEGVRIFNLSYNLRRPPGGAPYSLAAQGLDEIAIELDVIFVISAGNLNATEQRPEWPADSSQAVTMLASSTIADGLGSPAESISNVSVGAVNPPGMEVGIPGAPTRYTRRGIQVPSAMKPDFSAPGGGSPASKHDTSGLYALSSSGALVEVQGTSFASPLVARYLATLDSEIAGAVSRELLIALATHHAKCPEVLLSSEMSQIASSFVGYGMLPSVNDTLDGSAHSITIVLSDVILPGRRVEFPFRWPDSLTSPEGKCRGRVKLTLVSQPVLNSAHGSEMVRINLDGAVKQADVNDRFSGRVEPTHQFFSGFHYATERSLAGVLGKWYPVKSYERYIPRGIGDSGDWRLDIDYLTRAAESIPASGVRFAAVFTIEDPTGSAPVFEEMRDSLSAIGVTLSDLRTSIIVGVSARSGGSSLKSN